MCASVSVVKGEASESDISDEDEHYVFHQKNVSGAPIAGTVIGEASESDDDQITSVASSVATHYGPTNVFTSPKKFDSLLHKKLFECNISLYNSMMGLVRSTIDDSVSQLTEADQQLLKSQLRLQSASTALRNLQSTSKQLAERLSIAVYSSFIPKITIPIPDVDAD